MSRPLLLLAALAAPLGACELPSPPPGSFHILSVEPLTQKTNETKKVRLQLDADPSFHVDYGSPAARMVGKPTLEIGPRSVALTYLGHGQLEGYVEPLVPGPYEMRVRLGDGREATFAAPYQVTSVVRVTYEFTSIAPQVQGQPFTVGITVNVQGQVAGEAPYEGFAMLSIYSGGRLAFQKQIGPFSTGTMQQEVIIDQAGDDFVALLEDDDGGQAFSNAFPVDPPKN
ncbi:MAG: hypothetical protein ABW123_07550 [Cystobacter sp.]